MFEFLVLFIVLLVDAAYILILAAVNMGLEKPAVKNLGLVSVIICAKDGRTVEKILKNLKKIRKPKIEVIVATSDGETARIARRYTKKVVKDRGVGKGPALNVAVKRASGNMLYFLDEDMRVSGSTIEKVCSALNGNEVATGLTLPENKGGFARIPRLYMALLAKMQFGVYRLIRTTFVGGKNFAIYKKTLKEVGSFRNVLTEDIDISFRLFMRKKRVKFVNAVAFDEVPTKFSWYARQQQRWNSGAGRAMVEWEKRFHYHDFTLFMFIVLIALIPLMSLVFLLLALAFGSFLFLSVVVLCFLICLSSALSLGRRDTALMPATFLAMMFVQSALIFYSALSKPKGWYRTPKSLKFV